MVVAAVAAVSADGSVRASCRSKPSWRRVEERLTSADLEHSGIPRMFENVREVPSRRRGWILEQGWKSGTDEGGTELNECEDGVRMDGSMS